jgi:hypothetical protein
MNFTRMIHDEFFRTIFPGPERSFPAKLYQDTTESFDILGPFSTSYGLKRFDLRKPFVHQDLPLN